MKTENQANTVSAAQIEEWKKRYGKVWSATTTNEQGEEETAYFKPIDRTTMSYAISLESQHKTFEVAEHVLQNCWIAAARSSKRRYLTSWVR